MQYCQRPGFLFFPGYFTVSPSGDMVFRPADCILDRHCFSADSDFPGVFPDHLVNVRREDQQVGFRMPVEERGEFKIDR